jgi:hypothetical protein
MTSWLTFYGAKTMPKQDVTAFSLQYKTWCKDRLAGLVDVKPFEFFCADQFLKSRALTDAEILSGQVDAPHDGGLMLSTVSSIKNY